MNSDIIICHQSSDLLKSWVFKRKWLLTFIIVSRTELFLPVVVRFFVLSFCLFFGLYLVKGSFEICSCRRQCLLWWWIIDHIEAAWNMYGPISSALRFSHVSIFIPFVISICSKTCTHYRKHLMPTELPWVTVIDSAQLKPKQTILTKDDAKIIRCKFSMVSLNRSSLVQPQTLTIVRK